MAKMSNARLERMQENDGVPYPLPAWAQALALVGSLIISLGLCVAGMYLTKWLLEAI